ncbi:hypothetical protein [Aquisphaera insulae]|uniref:hypothetical protein n=1 Tax=Aquisphaera insulae TaxID=2712864 RepID=UPI0013E9C04F|nr:hypothetical protein [Aquisphaera insulae]
MSIVTIRSVRRFEHGLPSEPLGRALSGMQEVVRLSIAMAFRGQSTPRSKRPGWLQRMSDLRFLGFDAHDGTSLRFEAPALGEAAPELYRQGEFFWIERPDADDTGFDILGDVLQDVAEAKEDSDRFDPGLLGRLRAYSTVIHRNFDEFRIATRRHHANHPARIDARVVEQARTLHDRTPPPQAALIMGTLDMIRASTQAFGLRIADGREVACTYSGTDVTELSPLLSLPVLVTGRAVFRTSGGLLRMEADHVRLANDSDAFFARLPRPNGATFNLGRVLHEQRHKRGVAAILGQWPGDETDEELQAWLKEMG